jgi:leucyl-tRNA synthetase
MILGQDNLKMSKSRGNVVSPDDIIEEYGADALRLYEMFMGPLESTKPWSMSGVEGVYRFLARVWRLTMEEDQEGNWRLSPSIAEIETTFGQSKVVHATIKKVSQDIESLSFNTAISQMMIFVNEFTGVETKPVAALRTLLILLNPFAPHLSEELWSRMSQKFSGFDGQVSAQPWPIWDEQVLTENEVDIVIQVNGKLRDKITLKRDTDRAQLETTILALPKIKEAVSGKHIRKLIVIPNKLVNVVV